MTYTLAHLVAENKNHVVFQVKREENALARKKLESATGCGKFDAGRGAHEKLSLAACQ
jgi:hypothetical protein